MSKLTVTLPDDLHAQIRQELEEQGITTGQFIEMVVTKYFIIVLFQIIPDAAVPFVWMLFINLLNCR